MTSHVAASHELNFFPGRSRLAVVRDVLLIALCVSLMVGFLAQVWHGPAPASQRPAEQAGVAPVVALDVRYA